jgi:hypothetical protein
MMGSMVLRMTGVLEPELSTTGARLQDELLAGVEVEGIVLDAGQPHFVALPLS